MFKFKNTIGARIIILVSGLLVAMLVIGGTAIYMMKQIGDELHEIAKEDIPLSKHVTGVTINQLEQSVIFEQTLRLGEGLSSNPSEAAHVLKLIASFRELGVKLNKEFKLAEHIAAEGVKEALTAETSAKFKTFLKELTALDIAHEIYEVHALELMTLLSNGEIKKAGSLATKIEAEEEKINHAVEALLIQIEGFTGQSIAKASAHEETALLVIFILLGAMLVMSIILTFFIVNGIRKPLKIAVEAIEKLCKGETDFELVGTERSDEVGDVTRGLEIFRESAISNKTMTEEKQRMTTEKAEAG